MKLCEILESVDTYFNSDEYSQYIEYIENILEDENIYSQLNEAKSSDSTDSIKDTLKDKGSEDGENIIDKEQLKKFKTTNKDKTKYYARAIRFKMINTVLKFIDEFIKFIQKYQPSVFKVKFGDDTKTIKRIGHLIDVATTKFPNFEPKYGQESKVKKFARERIMDAQLDPDKFNSYITALFDDTFKVYSRPLKSNMDFGTIPIETLTDVIGSLNGESTGKDLVAINNKLEKAYRDTTIHDVGLEVNISESNLSKVRITLKEAEDSINKAMAFAGSSLAESYFESYINGTLTNDHYISESKKVTTDKRFGFDYDTGHKVTVYFTVPNEQNLIIVGNRYYKSKKKQKKEWQVYKN